MDQTSKKSDQPPKKEQTKSKKESSKRDKTSKKDATSGQKDKSDGNSSGGASTKRKRKMSDQERTETQPEKRNCNAERSTEASDTKLDEGKIPEAKSVDGSCDADKPAGAKHEGSTPNVAKTKVTSNSKSVDTVEMTDNPGPQGAANAASKEVFSSVPDELNERLGDSHSVVPPAGASGDQMADEAPSSQPGTGGLQFFVPPAPPIVSADVASLVLAARSYEAVGFMENDTSAAALVDYLIAVGTAVPIPKAVVANLFKERIHAPALKNSGVGSIPALSREVRTNGENLK
jgi:hypothetical protein